MLLGVESRVVVKALEDIPATKRIKSKHSFLPANIPSIRALVFFDLCPNCNALHRNAKENGNIEFFVVRGNLEKKMIKLNQITFINKIQHIKKHYHDSVSKPGSCGTFKSGPEFGIPEKFLQIRNTES